MLELQGMVPETADQAYSGRTCVANDSIGVSTSFSAMAYKPLVILGIILNACNEIDAHLRVIPRDIEVMINDSTYMNCSTSLLAVQVQWRHGNNYVYTGLSILEPYNDRFSVQIDALTGACNLVIRSVQPSDVGTYICTEDEGFGELRTAQLIVLGGYPVCKSNMHSDGVIGPNSCDIEPEEVKLSCSVKYHGNSLPVLQWRVKGVNECIPEGLFELAWSNNEVTYSLTMKGSLDLKNSSFICQTTRTSNEHYTCSSDAISSLYVLSSKVTVNMTMNDEVKCFANTSQFCSYKWKWFDDGNSSTESYNQILKPKKVGMHRCEATCSIRSKTCSVQSMYAKVYLEEAISTVTPESPEQHWMPLLALLLVPVLAVIGVILYSWRKRTKKRRPDEIEQQRREKERLLGLIATIRTKAAEERKKAIVGLTILDNELFVVSCESSDVEVYDSTTFSFSREWTLKELIDPVDIVSCHRNKCLYISDYKVKGLSREIFRVDPSGILIKKWSTKGDSGRLSVTYDWNVISAAYRENKLNEYSPDGQFIWKIHLSSKEGFCHPRHAIKLANGHFLVCHGDYDDDDDLHRVCIVDADGKLLKSFGGKRGSTIEQTLDPGYLSVDGNGFVIVVDSANHRVLSLDSNLEFKKEILLYEHGLRYPRRILLDESNGRIVVSNHEQNNSRILIFDSDLLRPTRNEVERRRLDEIERQRREKEERKRREEEERLRSLEVERRRQDEIERQRREKEERLRPLGFIATIRTKAEEEMQKSIEGLAILDNELFVVSDESSEVEVYDLTKFSFSREWTLKKLIDPMDIVSCHRNKCLYINDYKVKGVSKEICRVDPNGKLIKKWSTKMDYGLLSVTYDSNVILAAYHQNKLNEYSPDGQFIREIHLSSEEGFCNPRHAIKLSNGHFVVCHGSALDGDDSDLHRVCIVDEDGKLFKSFGEKRGSTIGKTHTPIYLSVDGSGSVLVADANNGRVLLLDSNLEFQKEILTEEHGLGSPYRILLDDSNSRLFVSDNYQKNSRIMIFDIGLQRQTIGTLP